ncbi:lymphoid-restricted membrane protein-like [Amblyraja radiata]|uniref:lymphoid-restricted membrane protein-like n=1 Tax=Amblyraja radiata TaxID=386614 RepID=UPI0014028F56|nr:lymphoid-restricted membrane protein-like [Amblyraja radiata]
MSALQKSPSLLRSQSASSLHPLPVASRINTPHPGILKDAGASAEVTIKEQQPLQKDSFVLLRMEKLKLQKSERENISATASTALADGAMETKNAERQETPQEKFDVTPANCKVQCDSGSSGDEQEGESDESGEDSSSSELLSSSAEEVPILKRLGLQREFYTEKEAETAFIHLSLAFKSDVFTLKERLQVEEHARDVAEENAQEELEGCKEILQRLGAICTDGRRQKIVKQLEGCLHILETSITRASSHSEVLGALHQEARVSQGMQVMIQHAMNLKGLHAKERAELQEMKRIVQQNSRNWPFRETRDDVDFRNKHQMMRAIHQSTARRRVSIAVIPKQLKIFHCPDSKMADREETGLAHKSAPHSGENGQPLDGTLRNPHEDLPENTVSNLSRQTPLLESSEKEDEGTLVDGSHKRRGLEEIAICKSTSLEETSTPSSDTPESSVQRCKQEETAGSATENEASSCDLNERDSEKEGGDESSPDTTSEGSLTLECLPPSTAMWSSLSTSRKMITFAVFTLTLTVAWMLAYLT